MSIIIRKNLDDEKKCGGCNWRTSTFYSFPSSDIDEDGLCAMCFMDMIVDSGMEVKNGQVEKSRIEGLKKHVHEAEEHIDTHLIDEILKRDNDDEFDVGYFLGLQRAMRIITGSESLEEVANG